MQNVPTGATGEAVSASKRINSRAQRPEDGLSFFRHATKAEVTNGADPLIHWSVEPSGSYSADVERGKLIAEELIRFVLAAPTYGNLSMLGCMLNDIVRFGDKRHRGLLIGFGGILLKFATIGASLVGVDAVRRHDAAEAVETMARFLRNDEFTTRLEAYEAERADIDAKPVGDEDAYCAALDAIEAKLFNNMPPITTMTGALAALKRGFVEEGNFSDTRAKALFRAVEAYLEERVAR